MDTQKITSELLASGLTQQELASMAKCSQSLISALLRGERGTRLSFEIGNRLIRLHKRRCAKRKDEAEVIAA
ncbi:helix-turn-helix domain-containing protein [Undibacterium baiyunense]|uniref:Helix-turn-helix domain-containing protein n=1 Tax=Undibacterium baiyunense TaxID=2828731 RepID=A0A941DG29_9BURK|nr:helix-turn-helix domain-containing protein [Undibacterium baiyunense]MBR7747431.1 helix-turn-helix domain-containing protein [Undibacterium baiyunense]